MQRLSGLDAMFFYLETPSSHMHVTGVYVMEPGDRATSFQAIRSMVEERLPLAAPFRRRLVEVPLKLSHPLWIEDPDFDLDYHVRRAALPAPGGVREARGVRRAGRRPAPRSVAAALGDVLRRRARGRQGRRRDQDAPRGD